MVGNDPRADQDSHTEGVAAESFSAAIPNRLYRDSSELCGKEWKFDTACGKADGSPAGKCIKRNSLVTDI